MKNLRRLAEEMLDLCNEVEHLRADNTNLRAEVKSLRDDMWESIRMSQQTHINWVEFCANPRVEIAVEDPEL